MRRPAGSSVWTGIEQQAWPRLDQALPHGPGGAASTSAGLNGGVQRRGVGPAEDLVLQLRVGQLVEELAEAVDQIALGHDDEDGEPHAQRPLDLVELLGDLARPSARSGRRCLVIRLSAGITSIIPLIGQFGPDLGQQLQELRPLAGGPGADLLETSCGRRCRG